LLRHQIDDDVFVDPEVSVPSAGLWLLRLGNFVRNGDVYKFQFPLRDYGCCDSLQAGIAFAIFQRFSSLCGIMVAATVWNYDCEISIRKFQFPLRDYGCCDWLSRATQLKHPMFQFPLRDYGCCDSNENKAELFFNSFQFPLRDYGCCDAVIRFRLR